MNKNIIWGIILILLLSFVFGMLYNLKEAYAYPNDFDNIENWSASNFNEFMITINDYVDNYGACYFKFRPDHIWISFDYQFDSYKKYLKTDGTYDGQLSSYTSPDASIIPNDSIYEAPVRVLKDLSQSPIIYFNQIDNTISINNQISTGMTPTEFKINHADLGLVQNITFELFNYQGNLISVTVPDHNSDYTIIDIPPGENPYYINFIKDPLETTLFYFTNQQDDLTFTMPQLNLIKGQAYYVPNQTSFKTIEFANQKPTQVYIYRENKDDLDDFIIENINPTEDKEGLNSTSFINLYTSDNTYFVIIDSQFNSHAVELTGLSSSNIQQVTDIPYVPSNISEIWQNIETGQPGIGDIDISLDTDIESLDTSKDELIFENISNVKMDIHLHPSVNSKHFLIKQEKRLDPDTMENYWVDITNPTTYLEGTVSLYPNQRHVVQIFNGTFDYEYQLQYIDGPDIIDYVHGVDYTLVTNYGVYGTDPTLTDGTGIINNTGSAVTYPEYPDTVENTNILDNDYSFENPYSQSENALESIKQSLGTVQSMVGIMFDNPITGVFATAFLITVPIAIFKFIRG